MGKEKGKKGLILKTLERCRSIGGQRKGEKRYVAPEGCFSVYVGPAKERFVVRMECINHPLFQTLLDEAEMEYGYATDGPLELPCNVELFNRVLWEMEQELVAGPPRCSFTRSHSGLWVLPAEPIETDGDRSILRKSKLLMLSVLPCTSYIYEEDVCFLFPCF